jgi:Ca2+-binding RTX toxin-like protein
VFTPDTLKGTSDADQITGTIASETLWGYSGDDSLDGGGGDDSLLGGVGNDTYIVDSLSDVVTEAGGEGIDEVRTSVGSRTDYTQMYTLPANVENLTGTSATGQGVYGNALDNVISMGDGRDLIVLHDGGNDTVSGGGGNDFLYYGGALTAADSNDGGDGYDKVAIMGDYTAGLTFDANDLINVEHLEMYTTGKLASPAGYNLTTHDANVAAGRTLRIQADTLTSAEALIFDGSAETDGKYMFRSGAGSDTLKGGANADDIDGGAGNDTIYGGAGNDWIVGGLGADHLWGDAGADRFVYTAAAQSSPATAIDWIKDFAVGTDKINLYGMDADGNAADGVTRFTFIGDSAFTNQAGQLRVGSGANGTAWVEADIDGDGTADFFIQITTSNAMPLARSDFEI